MCMYSIGSISLGSKFHGINLSLGQYVVGQFDMQSVKRAKQTNPFDMDESGRFGL